VVNHLIAPMKNQFVIRDLVKNVLEISNVRTVIGRRRYVIMMGSVLSVLVIENVVLGKAV